MGGSASFNLGLQLMQDRQPFDAGRERRENRLRPSSCPAVVECCTNAACVHGSGCGSAVTINLGCPKPRLSPELRVSRSCTTSVDRSWRRRHEHKE